MTTQEALAGQVLETDEGLVHEHCGDEFEVSENERRREHGDVVIDWKLSGEQTLPADYDPEAQADAYRELLGMARGRHVHDAIERAVRGD
jgi:hypothetical protein